MIFNVVWGKLHFLHPMIEIEIAGPFEGKFDKIYKNCNMHIDHILDEGHMSKKGIKAQ